MVARNAKAKQVPNKNPPPQTEDARDPTLNTGEETQTQPGGTPPLIEDLNRNPKRTRTGVMDGVNNLPPANAPVQTGLVPHPTFRVDPIPPQTSEGGAAYAQQLAQMQQAVLLNPFLSLMMNAMQMSAGLGTQQNMNTFNTNPALMQANTQNPANAGLPAGTQLPAGANPTQARPFHTGARGNLSMHGTRDGENGNGDEDLPGERSHSNRPRYRPDKRHEDEVSSGKRKEDDRLSLLERENRNLREALSKVVEASEAGTQERERERRNRDHENNRDRDHRDRDHEIDDRPYRRERGDDLEILDRPPRRERRRDGRPGSLRASPLVDRILFARAGEGKIPSDLPLYNGTTDPEEHTIAFDNHAHLFEHSDDYWAKLFVTTLRGSAYAWYRRLPPRSIDSYYDLITKFESQFSPLKVAKFSTTYIWSIKQRKDESLCDFFLRFGTELTKVETPSTDFLRQTVYNSLNDSKTSQDCADAIIREKPKDMIQLKRIASKYMEQEDMARMKSSQRLKSEIHPKAPPREEKKEKKNWDPARRFDGPRIELNKRNSEILAITGPKVYNAPKPMKDTDQTKNSDQWCSFHQQFGHDTDNCRALENEIQRLIRGGKLQEFVKSMDYFNKKNGKGSSSNHEKKPNNEQPPKKDKQKADDNLPFAVINMISGGATNGDTKTLRKKAGRRFNQEPNGDVLEVLQVEKMQVLGFTDQDYDNVMVDENGECPDCPMVIEVDIFNTKVKRALVDSGSSVNVMPAKTWKKLCHPSSTITLSAVETPLIGFGGSPLYPLGQVKLASSMGTAPKRQTLPLVYTVVEIDLPYNVILGRPALAKFRAIHSTFHRKMKFPTPNGVGEVCCNMKEAWECYMLSINAPKPPSEQPLETLHTNDEDMPDMEGIPNHKKIKFEQKTTKDDAQLSGS